MSQADIQAAILRVFAQHRENPAASLDAENLASHLMADNRPLDKVRNSFKALRRLNAFYGALQLECAVCFEDNIAEKNWSVESLAEHIAAKKKNPSAQKALVTKRIKRAERNLHFEPVKFAIFVIGPIALILFMLALKISGSLPFALVFPALGIAAVGGLYRITWGELAFYRKLGQLIQKQSD